MAGLLRRLFRFSGLKHGPRRLLLCGEGLFLVGPSDLVGHESHFDKNIEDKKMNGRHFCILDLHV